MSTLGEAFTDLPSPTWFVHVNSERREYFIFTQP